MRLPASVSAALSGAGAVPYTPRVTAVQTPRDEARPWLEAEVERVAGDPAVRAIVIRGAGEENFSVGMNLKQLPEGVARMGSLDAVLDQRLRVLDAIENLPKPVIAVLYGYCLGGGLELPLALVFSM